MGVSLVSRVVGASLMGGRTDGACVAGSVVGGRNHFSLHISHTPSEQEEAEKEL